MNIKSLEDVVRAYLKLAEEKTETAKEESQQMVLDIEDLDNIQTPERYNEMRPPESMHVFLLHFVYVGEEKLRLMSTCMQFLN